MSRTIRAEMIPAKNLFPKEEWENYERNHGITHERYLATCYNDRREGRWYPPKYFRQVENQLYRAKAEQTIKNFVSQSDFEQDIEIPKKVRNIWWKWF